MAARGSSSEPSRLLKRQLSRMRLQHDPRPKRMRRIPCKRYVVTEVDHDAGVITIGPAWRPWPVVLVDREELAAMYPETRGDR